MLFFYLLRDFTRLQIIKTSVTFKYAGVADKQFSKTQSHHSGFFANNLTFKPKSKTETPLFSVLLFREMRLL